MLERYVIIHEHGNFSLRGGKPKILEGGCGQGEKNFREGGIGQGENFFLSADNHIFLKFYGGGYAWGTTKEI